MGFIPSDCYRKAFAKIQDIFILRLIMSKICVSLVIFVLIGLSTSKPQNSRIGIDDTTCPGTAACAKCENAFSSNNDGYKFENCEKSCDLCPLCKLFHISPGCDYCGDNYEAVADCKGNCVIGETICPKCKKYC